jgi:hypothetical protein
MSRFVHFRELSADEVVKCSYDMLAILDLCKSIADTAQINDRARIADMSNIGSALGLAMELAGLIHDTIETQEQVSRGTTTVTR